MPFDLAAGFNLISVPFASTGGYDAKSLAEAIDPGGAVASILKWDAGYAAWLQDFGDEKNFPIEPGAGYFVRMTSSIAGFQQ